MYSTELKACLAILLLLSHGVASFQFLAPKVSRNPDVLKHVQDQAGTLLNFRLELGTSNNRENTQARFHLTGLSVKLSPNPTETSDKKHPRMPGAHGPHSKYSSGCFQVDVTKEGSFVDMTGLQSVSLNHGVWEINWRENAPAGSIVCGFQVAKEYRRNEAILPKGNLYFAFPVFTKEGLEKAQEGKEKALLEAKALVKEYEAHFDMMKATPNPLMKALHFRNAYAAWEKHSYTKFQDLKMIPSNEEIVDIGNGLFMTDKGTVWTKGGNVSRSKSQVLLGTAFVSMGMKLGELSP